MRLPFCQRRTLRPRRRLGYFENRDAFVLIDTSAGQRSSPGDLFRKARTPAGLRRQTGGNPRPHDLSVCADRAVHRIERGIERWHARNEAAGATAPANGAGTGVRGGTPPRQPPPRTHAVWPHGVCCSRPLTGREPASEGDRQWLRAPSRTPPCDASANVPSSRSWITSPVTSLTWSSALRRRCPPAGRPTGCSATTKRRSNRPGRQASCRA